MMRPKILQCLQEQIYYLREMVPDNNVRITSEPTVKTMVDKKIIKIYVRVERVPGSPNRWRQRALLSLVDTRNRNALEHVERQKCEPALTRIK